MKDPPLCLRPRGLPRARLELGPLGSALAGAPGLAPLPGSRLLSAASLRAGSGLRVSRGVSEAQLGGEAWVSARRALIAGDADRARAAFARARGADAAFLAAGLAVVASDVAGARDHFEQLRTKVRTLGRDLRRSRLTALLWLEAPGGLVACIGPERRGVLLALLLLREATGRVPAVLDDVLRLARGDVGVRLLACDCLLAGGAPTPTAARRIVRVSEGVGSDQPATRMVQLFRARALRRLGRAGEAARVCSRASTRSPKNHTLAAALRLEHAAALTDLGAHQEAKRKLGELERLAPGFAGRAQRRGIELALET